MKHYCFSSKEGKIHLKVALFFLVLIPSTSLFFIPYFDGINKMYVLVIFLALELFSIINYLFFGDIITYEIYRKTIKPKPIIANYNERIQVTDLKGKAFQVSIKDTYEYKLLEVYKKRNSDTIVFKIEIKEGYFHTYFSDLNDFGSEFGRFSTKAIKKLILERGTEKKYIKYGSNNRIYRIYK